MPATVALLNSYRHLYTPDPDLGPEVTITLEVYEPMSLLFDEESGMTLRRTPADVFISFPSAGEVTVHGPRSRVRQYYQQHWSGDNSDLSIDEVPYALLSNREIAFAYWKQWIDAEGQIPQWLADMYVQRVREFTGSPEQFMLTYINCESLDRSIYQRDTAILAADWLAAERDGLLEPLEVFTSACMFRMGLNPLDYWVSRGDIVREWAEQHTVSFSGEIRLRFPSGLTRETAENRLSEMVQEMYSSWGDLTQGSSDGIEVFEQAIYSD